MAAAYVIARDIAYGKDDLATFLAPHLRDSIRQPFFVRPCALYHIYSSIVKSVVRKWGFSPVALKGNKYRQSLQRRPQNIKVARECIKISVVVKDAKLFNVAGPELCYEILQGLAGE